MTFSTISTDERNRSEVPLGLDSHEVAPEFARVWIGEFKLPPEDDLFFCFDTESDAWAYRGRFAADLIDPEAFVTEVTLSTALGYAAQERCSILQVWNGKGEVLKEYPV